MERDPLRAVSGPEDRLGPGIHSLAPGVWLTTGRAVVLEGEDHLALVDPGDEPVGTLASPLGPLADLRSLEADTGKGLRWILLTHSHPDHVANLGTLRAAAPGVRVVAHARSPLAPDVRIAGRTRLALGGGLEAIPTPGHCAEGDDLSFWRPEGAVLLSGDLVQPKGESWGAAFYPSPWPYFTDPRPYLESLEALQALPVAVLATGHREVRWGAEARSWVDLTRRAIRRVGELVAEWGGAEDIGEAGPAVFRALAAERGIAPEAVEQRLARRGGEPSAFECFDLPGIAWFWECRRGE